jgi:TRAP-type C4-dicarboxylate transport system permease small subunit
MAFSPDIPLRWLLRALSWIIGFLLFMQVVVILGQVLLRNVLGLPLVWSEELARYLTIFLTFLGGAIATANDEHVVVDVIVNLLPRRLQILVGVFADLAVAAFLILLIKLSIDMFRLPTLWFQYSPALRFPLVYLYLSLPIGCTLMLLFLIVRMIQKVRLGRPTSLATAAPAGK